MSEAQTLERLAKVEAQQETIKEDVTMLKTFKENITELMTEKFDNMRENLHQNTSFSCIVQAGVFPATSFMARG